MSTLPGCQRQAGSRHAQKKANPYKRQYLPAEVPRLPHSAARPGIAEGYSDRFLLSERPGQYSAEKRRTDPLLLVAQEAPRLLK